LDGTFCFFQTGWRIVKEFMFVVRHTAIIMHGIKLLVNNNKGIFVLILVVFASNAGVAVAVTDTITDI
jgi:hypothetical protein